MYNKKERAKEVLEVFFHLTKNMRGFAYGKDCSIKYNSNTGKWEASMKFFDGERMVTSLSLVDAVTDLIDTVYNP